MATSPKQVNHMDAIVSSESTRTRREDVMIGDLPTDFLRIDSLDQPINDLPMDDRQRQISLDEQTALALQNQQYQMVGGFQGNVANIKGRLDITVVEAKLTKNYGVTRMDPYVRVRVGHHVYETKTCYNGAKNPKWNKVFHCFLPNGVDSIHVEIYDECAFTVDDKIAWALQKIPDSVLEGQTVEDWILLTGRQGQEKEGQICVVMSFTPMPGASAMFPVAAPTQTVVMQPYGLVTSQAPAMPQVYIQPGPPPGPQPLQPSQQIQQLVINEEDIKQVQEMFPNIDVEVIKVVMETQRGNKDRTINSLLQMNTE